MIGLSLAAVEGVKITALNITAAKISWITLESNILLISYTAMYSEETQQNSSESQRAVFSPSSTFGVVTNLNKAISYQFKMFATFTVDNRSLVGNTSHAVIYSFTCK